MLAILFSISLLGGIGATGVGFYALSEYRPSLYNRIIQILCIAPFALIAIGFMTGHLLDVMSQAGDAMVRLNNIELEGSVENTLSMEAMHSNMQQALTNPAIICIFLAGLASLVSKVFFVQENQGNGGDLN